VTTLPAPRRCIIAPNPDELFDGDASHGETGRDRPSQPPSLVLQTVSSVTMTALACRAWGWPEGETGVEESELEYKSTVKAALDAARGQNCALVDSRGVLAKIKAELKHESDNHRAMAITRWRLPACTPVGACAYSLERWCLYHVQKKNLHYETFTVRTKQLCLPPSITAPKIPPSALKSGESDYVVSGKLWAECCFSGILISSLNCKSNITLQLTLSMLGKKVRKKKHASTKAADNWV
jgi:hypothetical protein